MGKLLSPTIFGIFINDIVDDVKSVNVVVNIDGNNITWWWCYCFA